jgi:hypothetical protein
MRNIGKLIVIESNDDEMKNIVISKLINRLSENTNVNFARMDEINNTTNSLQAVTLKKSKYELGWRTSLNCAESILLLKIGDNASGIKHLTNNGTNIIIDQFDVSLFVKFVPEEVESSFLFSNINKHIISAIKPSARILLAVSKSDLSKDEDNKFNSTLNRYCKIYRRENLENDCRILHFSDSNFNEACDNLEEIVRKIISS